jgi:nicotinate-nucleotide adenylyltransferase
MRLGLFGGTFDPPHEGHLAVARAARDALRLDRVEIVPSARPPHRGAPATPAVDRYAMAVLAFLGEERLAPSPRELLRTGLSYTITTLAELAEEHPGAELFLVLGADSYDELPTWHRWEEIAAAAHLAVVPRPGSRGAIDPRPADRDRLLPPDQAPPPGGRGLYALPMEPVPLASRELRRQLASAPEQVAGVPAAVRRYITLRGLYSPQRRS